MHAISQFYKSSSMRYKNCSFRFFQPKQKRDNQNPVFIILLQIRVFIINFIEFYCFNAITNFSTLFLGHPTNLLFSYRFATQLGKFFEQRNF